MFESIHCLEQLANIILRRLQQNDLTLTEIFFAHYFKGTFINILEVIKLLKTNSTVIKLFLSSLPINNKEMEQISKMLQFNNFITKLWIIECSLTEDSIKILADALRVNTTLVSLNISYNLIRNNGMMEICNAIKENHNNKLKILDVNANDIIYDDTIINSMLSFKNPQFPFIENIDELEAKPQYSNSITPDGFDIMCTHIKDNTFPNLNKIKLLGCISDLSLVKLCKALLNNKTIEYLNISYNNFSEKAFHNIGIILKYNNTLLCLYLDNTNMNSIGATNLSNSLILNSSLKCLSLDNNMIGDRDNGIVALKDALINNNSLRKLSIDYSGKPKYQEAIIQLLTNNTYIIHEIFHISNFISIEIETIMHNCIKRNLKILDDMPITVLLCSQDLLSNIIGKNIIHFVKNYIENEKNLCDTFEFW